MAEIDWVLPLMAAILIFKCTEAAGVRRQAPGVRDYSSFETHARWQPVTQSAQSRQSYGKIGDCEQSRVKFRLWCMLRNASYLGAGNDPRRIKVRASC